MDRQRLADALAYDQARRSRLASFVPMPADGQPETVSAPSLRSNLENLSIGLGEGLTNQLEGVRALVTDPIGTAKGTYEAVRGVVRDPSVIAQALREMSSRAASGPLGAGEVVGEMLGPMRGRPAPDMLELDVYHGTPHRFPATEANPLGEFDASKIGTGEGAQAYGHGVYLAQAPDVAEGYRRTLVGKINDRVTVDGKPVKDDIFGRAVEKMGLFGKKSALQDIDDQINFYSKYEPDFAEYYKSARKQIEDLDPESVKVNKGNLYKADLPDEMIDRMLDWDKPLSKDAPQAVKDAFNKLAQTYPDLKEKLFAAYREGKPGSHYYSLLNDYAKTGDLVKNQTFASDAMRQAGIPGIKYLDAGSRGQSGSGTRNFVVFPGEEKKVKILKRE